MPAEEASPPVTPIITAYYNTPSDNSFPSYAFAIILVPAPAAMPPATSAVTITPTLAAVLPNTRPPAPPASAPPATEIGAAIAPPAAPIEL